MKLVAPPHGWRNVKLGEVISLEYGKNYPEKTRRPGNYAVYGSNGIVGRADQYLVEEPTLIIGRKGSAGEINKTEPYFWPIDTTYYVELKNRNLYSIDYLYYAFSWLDLKPLVETTTKPGLNRDRVYEKEILLPPVSVQERIVKILQKADDIRRKRREALKIAEAVLPALFYEMFGDPTDNPKGYNKTMIGEKTSLVTSGYTPRGGAINYISDGAFLIRSQNVQMLSLNLDDCAHIPVKIFSDMSRVRVFSGDVLLNITGASIGRVAWVDREINDAVVNQHVCIIRPTADLLPAYLAITLSSPWYQHVILNAPGSAQTGFNHSRVRALEILVPPKPVQLEFVRRIQALRLIQEKCKKALFEANATFDNLINQAFTGELTAAWEAAHAEKIAFRQKLHEQLPSLLLLAFIQAKAEQTKKLDAMLITALMKYVFLAQMEGESRRRLFHFVPYHYGPFSKEVYDGLEELQRRGVVTVEESPDEGKTRILLADPAAMVRLLADLPADLRRDAETIVERYGALDHNELLKMVYEKYPAYARKSLLKKKKL